MVEYNNPFKETVTQMDGWKETHNINIAIASAVTAYARIDMSEFKNNPKLPNLYYTDTDSLYFGGPIPSDYISETRLGALKIEGVWDDVLFLAPKVYALRNKTTEVIKIKGLSKESIKNNNITFDSLLPLLTKDHKQAYNQDKWFRSLSEANIKILEQTYNLKATGNKRELIYDNNILTSTAPLKINKD